MLVNIPNNDQTLATTLSRHIHYWMSSDKTGSRVGSPATRVRSLHLLGATVIKWTTAGKGNVQ